VQKAKKHDELNEPYNISMMSDAILKNHSTVIL